MSHAGPDDNCSHPVIPWLIHDGKAHNACATHDADYAAGGSLGDKLVVDGRFARRLWNLGGWWRLRAPVWWAAVSVGGLRAWNWRR